MLLAGSQVGRALGARRVQQGLCSQVAPATTQPRVGADGQHCPHLAAATVFLGPLAGTPGGRLCGVHGRAAAGTPTLPPPGLRKPLPGPSSGGKRLDAQSLRPACRVLGWVQRQGAACVEERKDGETKPTSVLWGRRRTLAPSPPGLRPLCRPKEACQQRARPWSRGKSQRPLCGLRGFRDLGLAVLPGHRQVRGRGTDPPWPRLLSRVAPSDPLLAPPPRSGSEGSRLPRTEEG